MINLKNEIVAYQQEGLSAPLARARVSQDVVLLAISKGSLKRNITIKGGIVMRSITNCMRRATRDIDLDFVHYPLSEDGINSFVERLNCIDGLTIERTGDIEELTHQDYHGKRIYLEIKDTFDDVIIGKLDIGVHTHFSLEQEEYCFDVCMNDEGVSLLKNTAEQVFAEKLRSLLVWGADSRRYKDVYDMYYLKDVVDQSSLLKVLELMIFSDSEMPENTMVDIIARLNEIFNDKDYIEALDKSRQRWIDENIQKIIELLLAFMCKL